METTNPKTPRPAATVILIRPHKDEFQVYLLKRNEKSGFMGGYYVFPGGTVDFEDRDAGIWQQHVDMDVEEIVHRLGGGMDLENILAYGVAAMRETFEEAGVLLVRQAQQREEDLERICRRRSAVPLPKGGFRELIVSESWMLAFSRLKRWSHWITPELMKRRYDTRFFLTVLSKEQVCRPDRHETVHGLWITPLEGLMGNRDGRIPLSPPTLVTLHELSGYRQMKDLESALESRSWGVALFPRLVPVQNGAVILEPWDPAHRQDVITFDLQTLEKAVLPVEAPFSRIWLHKGIWRAVACD
jgi:8-oxo-dGTP pyrophosphatase MutT (NUDIX family)